MRDSQPSTKADSKSDNYSDEKAKMHDNGYPSRDTSPAANKDKQQPPSIKMQDRNVETSNHRAEFGSQRPDQTKTQTHTPTPSPKKS